MGVSTMSQLENAVNRLLQRNVQLQDRCDSLTAEQDHWRQQRREVLMEVESLLADLELLRKQHI
jgi:chromosome segregation ATPase